VALALIAVVGWTAACGGSGPTGGGRGPVPTTTVPATGGPGPPPAPGPVGGGGQGGPGGTGGVGSGPGLTDADNGRTLTRRVGDVIDGELRPTVGWVWSAVTVSDPTVLVGLPDPAEAAVRGARLFRLRAARPGTATVTAFQTPDCPPGAACPALARNPVTVTVVVDQ